MALGYPLTVERLSLLKTLGSVLAGAVGFAVGFYAAFFLILGIWGLEFDSLAFPLIGGGSASLFAGIAIALTVSRSRRVPAILTALGLGLILAVLLIAISGDVGALALGGLLLVVLTAVLTRSGALDRFAGSH